MKHFEQGRLCLQCTNCGHETTGWAIGVAAMVMLTIAVPGFGQSVAQCQIIGQRSRCVIIKTNVQANLEVLQKHLESNVTDIRFGVSTERGRSGSTGSHGPTAGPWDFPPERPARRLDGTLTSDPVTVYGPDTVYVLVPQGNWDHASPWVTQQLKEGR